MLVEGVDFTRDAMSLEDAGWRSMAANLSDLAAMGARPVLATVALGLSEATSGDDVRRLYAGIAACAQRWKLAIAGGDLSRAPALTVAIAVVGEVRASHAKRRGGGRPGDVLAVTGALGSARAGLELSRKPQAIAPELSESARQAFSRPQPRVDEGRFLAASTAVRALIDLSDGLSTDLGRLAAAGECGAELHSVPVADDARAVARARGEEPEAFALAGGEDFELLAAIRARAFPHLAARYAARFARPLLPIGVLREGSGVIWNGAPLPRTGWDHFAP